MGNIIKCCRYCVAPKRHPGCHGTCPEYIEQRAEYDKIKAVHDAAVRVGINCRAQKEEAMRKALRGRK